MDIKIDLRAHRTVVYCTGRMDASGGPEVEKAVMPLLKPHEGIHSTRVAVDFSGVSYISSAGIRSLMILGKAAHQLASGLPKTLSPLRIINLTPTVKEVLSLEGLGTDLASWGAAETKGPGEIKEHDYHKVLQTVMQAFPAPVHDPVKDSYFVHTINRGVDLLDDMKTDRPYLGEFAPLDYDKARKVRVAENIYNMEDTVAETVKYLQGMTIWGHPRTQVNVIPPPSIPSIVGQLLGSIHNPNIIWDELSHKLAEAEVEVASMCAGLVGYDPEKSAGIFTFGGTGTILYGVKLGVEKAEPGAFANGVRQDLKLLSSDTSHYAKYSVLGWLGIGTKNIVSIPTDEDNSMDLEELNKTLRSLLDKGEKIACITATMGTTDAFGIDNLEYIVHLRDKLVEEYKLPYKPHVHADAVIGWAWSVFNDYDFAANPMDFSPRTLRSLWDAKTGISSLKLADSIGIDFHKTGFAPYTSSLFLCRNKDDINLIAREKDIMPYLFQFGNYHPGVYTLETSRPGGSVLSAWANLRFFGKEGYRALLGHVVSMAEALRHRMEHSDFVCLINDYNYGPVTLFRVYPEGVDTKTAYRRETAETGSKEELLRHNEYNRRIFKVLHRQMEEGNGIALSITDHYRTAANGESILALKSYVMSPFADQNAMDRLMECLVEARKEVALQPA